MAEAGNVWVSVLPSLRGFVSKVNSEMKGIRDVVVDVTPKVDAGKARREVATATKAASQDAVVQLDLDVRAAQAKAKVIRAQLDELGRKEVTPKVELQTAKLNADLGRVNTRIAELSRKRADIVANIDLDTGAATQKVTAWSRIASRAATVQAKVETDKKSWSDALVGAHQLGRAMSMLALPAAALAATPYLVSLAASAMEATGALYLLPAAGVAAALGVGTVAVAFNNFGAAVGSDPKKAAEAMAKLAPSAQLAAQAVNGLKPAWQGLQLDVQSRMMDQLAGRITSLGTTYIPILRGAMAGLASIMNEQLRAAMDVLARPPNVAGITVALANLNLGFANLRGAVAPVTQAFLTLVMIGSTYFPMLGAAIGSAGARFGAFIQAAAATGRINLWINNAIMVLRQLGQIAWNVGSILGSMFGAARAAGEPFLSVLVRITGAAAAALRTPEGAAGLTQFFAIIRGLVAGFIDRLVILWPLISSLGVAFFRLLDAAHPLLDVVFRLVVAALVPMADALAWMAPVLGPVIAALWLLNAAAGLSQVVVWGLQAALWAYNGVMVAVRVATTIWTGVQWLLNAALAANPIGLVVIAIAALVAGVIYAYTHFEWFRNIVQAAWNIISTAASLAWNYYYKPILTAIWTALQFVGGIFVWLWQSVIVPAWNGIAAAASFAWGILSAIFNFISLAVRFVAAIFLTVLLTPFILGWQAIAAIASWAWTNVLQPVWLGAIVPALQFLGSIFTWLWQSVVVPVWNGITLAVQIAWMIIQAIWNAIIGFIVGIFAATWRFLIDGVIRPVWNAIVLAIQLSWAIIQAIWNVIISFITGIFAATFRWFYDAVVKPVWDAIGAVINFVWTNVINPTFQAVSAGLRWLADRFRDGVNWITDIWNGLRAATARPVNFLIGTVWNNGIVKAWNLVAGLLGLGAIAPLGLIPEFARGGRVDATEGGMIAGPGTGTSDDIVARLSNGEFVVRASVAKRIPYFLNAINDGQPEALQAAGGRRGTMPGYKRLPPGRMLGFQAGGPVAAGQQFARSQQGKPYVWGGVGPGGYDCSGWISAVTNVLRGQAPHRRIGATGSFPWGGFTPGLTSAWAVGSTRNAGNGIGHMAGTLGGLNTESSGGRGVHSGGDARGADNGLFNMRYSLPQVGGAFASGGAGGGGFFNFLRAAVENAFNTITNPLIAAIAAFTGPPPPEYRRVPPAAAVKMRDSVRDWLLAKADAMFGAMGGAGGMDVSGITGPVVDQVRQVAARFGWGSGPEWDAIVRLVQKESSWNPAAANRSSSARGLFQKMTSIHGPVESTPAGQAAWGLNYIRSRYGTPTRALAFHNAHNYYDSGGILPPGVSMAINATGRNEHMAVFTTEQWRLLARLITRLADLPGALRELVDGLRNRIVEAIRRALPAPAGTSGGGASGGGTDPNPYGTQIRPRYTLPPDPTALPASPASPISRMLTAAQKAAAGELLRHILGGGSFFEDFSYRGYSSTLRANNDVLAEAFYGQGGLFDKGQIVAWLQKVLSQGHFDAGGLASGLGILAKQTISPERVLSPRQTVAFERLVESLSRSRRGAGLDVHRAFDGGGYGTGRAGGAVVNVYPSARMDEGDLADAAVHRLNWEMGLIG